MDKNTMVFLIIVLFVVAVVGFLFWKSYESQRAETNKSDVGVAIANNAGSVLGEVAKIWQVGKS